MFLLLQSFRMILLLRDHPIVGEGCYAKVFRKDDYAIKVFKRPPEPTEHDLHQYDIQIAINRRKQIFLSEVSAYQTALEIDGMRRYVHHFRGKCVISRVSDMNNNDISDDFLLDCAYAMTYLPVEWIKYGTNMWNFNTGVMEARKLFISNGIGHMNDFSFYLDECGNVAGVIDFAIEEFPLCD
jgi:hypothetical protein